MKIRMDILFLKLQALVLTGIVVAQALGWTRAASGLFALTFLFTGGFWLSVSFRQISRRNLLALLTAVTACICVGVNALAEGTAVSFSYLKKLVMFCCTLLLLGAVGECRPTQEDAAFLFRANTVTALFCTAMYACYPTNMHLLNGLVTDYLTFRFTNPNLTGGFLASAAMLELLRAMAEKRGNRMVHWLLGGILSLFVWKTRSRNAQLLLFFFLTVLLSVKFSPRQEFRISRTLAAIVALSPLLFAVCYLIFIRIPNIQEVFSFLVGTGKDLDSRVEIWCFALENFRASPLFGAYSQISEKTGVSQLHNSHLDLLASYGAVVLAMLWALLTALIREEKTGKLGFLCKIGFVALLFSGMGEAMLFSGGMGIYLYAGVFLALANVELEGEKRE